MSILSLNWPITFWSLITWKFPNSLRNHSGKYSRQWLLDPFWRQRIFWGGLELCLTSASKATDTSFWLWMRSQVSNKYCTLMLSCCVSAATEEHAGIFLGFSTFLASIILHYSKCQDWPLGKKYCQELACEKWAFVLCIALLDLFIWEGFSPFKHLYEWAIDHVTPRTEHSISGFRSHSSPHFAPAHLWSSQLPGPFYLSSSLLLSRLSSFQRLK